MANRLIRDKILSSDRVNNLSAGAEVFYRRLMSVADDFGRYDGRIAILRSNLYPLRTDKISDEDMNAWIKECVDSDVIDFYYVDNKPYVEIWNFGQTIRIKKAKFPENPDKRQASVQHLKAYANKCEQMTDTRMSGVGVETNPIQSGVGVGLQENSAPTPTNIISENWNDMPKAEDVPEPPPKNILEAAVMQVGVLQRVVITEEDALTFWKTWKVQYLNGTKHYKSIYEVHSHYLNCIKQQKFNVKNITDASQRQELSPNAQRLIDIQKQIPLDANSRQNSPAGTGPGG